MARIKSESRKYADRSDYLKQAVAKRRRKVKELAVEYKGGKCCYCGYNRDISALEFHHLVPTAKDFNISYRGHSRSWDKVKAELDRCVLVCANCHREIHSKLLQPHLETNE